MHFSDAFSLFSGVSRLPIDYCDLRLQARKKNRVLRAIMTVSFDFSALTQADLPAYHKQA